MVEKGVFGIIEKDEIPKEANALRGRFVLAIEEKGEKNDRFKARFVVQGHRDRENFNLVHLSTNLKQSSIRLLTSIPAIF